MERTYYHENSFVSGWVENGILHAEYKAVAIDLPAAITCVALRLSTLNDKSFPAIIDGKKVKSMSKEARNYFASPEGYKHIAATALVLDSAVSKIIGNFFLRINKPPIPTRIFTDKAEAFRWLSPYVKK